MWLLLESGERCSRRATSGDGARLEAGGPSPGETATTCVWRFIRGQGPLTFVILLILRYLREAGGNGIREGRPPSCDGPNCSQNSSLDIPKFQSLGT